jgi:hypothetical protein
MRGAPAARGTAFYWVEGRLRCLLARRSKFSSFSLCPQLHYTPYTWSALVFYKSPGGNKTSFLLPRHFRVHCSWCCRLQCILWKGDRNVRVCAPVIPVIGLLVFHMILQPPYAVSLPSLTFQLCTSGGALCDLLQFPFLPCRFLPPWKWFLMMMTTGLGLPLVSLLGFNPYIQIYYHFFHFNPP